MNRFHKALAVKAVVACVLFTFVSRAQAATTELACITKRWTEHFVFDPDAIKQGIEAPSVRTDMSLSRMKRDCVLMDAPDTSIHIGCVSQVGKPPNVGLIKDYYRVDRITGSGTFSSNAAPDEWIHCIPDRTLF